MKNHFHQRNLSFLLIKNGLRSAERRVVETKRQTFIIHMQFQSSSTDHIYANLRELEGNDWNGNCVFHFQLYISFSLSFKISEQMFTTINEQQKRHNTCIRSKYGCHFAFTLLFICFYLFLTFSSPEKWRKYLRDGLIIYLFHRYFVIDVFFHLKATPKLWSLKDPKDLFCSSTNARKIRARFCLFKIHSKIFVPKIHLLGAF